MKIRTDNIKYKERIKIYNHKRYLKNKIKILKASRIWQLKHKKRMRDIQKRSKFSNIGRMKWNNLRMRIKRTTYKILMTKIQFINWYNNHQKVCHYCKITEPELKKNRKFGLKSNYLTIDRKDNDKNYSLDNITLACARCNAIKSDFFTEKEMLMIGRKYVAIKRL